MECHSLWLQQRLRRKELELFKVLGTENPADLFTKHVESAKKLEDMMRLFNCRFEAGRPAAAPQLKKGTAAETTHEAGGGAAMTVATGLGLMWVSGVVAGVAGASGGFIKTPVTTEIMGIPLKIAASTTTFTIGVTAAAGLVVFALQGRIDPFAAAAVIAGSLIGGQVGAALQARAPTSIIRRGLGGLLLLIAVLLVVSA